MGRGGFISGTLFSHNITFSVFVHMVTFLVMCFQLIFFSARHWESGVGNVEMGARGTYCVDRSIKALVCNTVT